MERPHLRSPATTTKAPALSLLAWAEPRSALSSVPTPAAAVVPATTPTTGEPGEPWEHPASYWEALEPRSSYARSFRKPFLYGVTLVLFLPALLAALPVVLVNAHAHGCGGILFIQERVGRRGRVFRLLKFRTMRGEPGNATDELRVTHFGRFLRNTHLDELPQLWNVLRGDMCLIGPRPEMLAIEAWANRFLPRFADRLVLRPGVTGWAQVTQGYAGDGDEIAYARKLSINTRYRAALSVGTDVRILVRTAFWMLRARGWLKRGSRR